MNAETVFRSMLEDVIQLQGLDDLSPFFEDGYFEEAPFFSRASDVAFLDRLGREGAERALISFGLDYLERVVDSEVPKSDFLAALTMTEFGKRDVLVPNIFVCNGRVEERLAPGLILEPVRSSFARRIREHVEAAGRTDHFEVFEDRRTVPRHVRVFIGPRESADARGVPIRRFLHDVPAANGHSRRP